MLAFASARFNLAVIGIAKASLKSYWGTIFETLFAIGPTTQSYFEGSFVFKVNSVNTTSPDDVGFSARRQKLPPFSGAALTGPLFSSDHSSEPAVECKT